MLVQGSLSYLWVGEGSCPCFWIRGTYFYHNNLQALFEKASVCPCVPVSVCMYIYSCVWASVSLVTSLHHQCESVPVWLACHLCTSSSEEIEMAFLAVWCCFAHLKSLPFGGGRHLFVGICVQRGWGLCCGGKLSQDSLILLCGGEGYSHGQTSVFPTILTQCLMVWSILKHIEDSRNKGHYVILANVC